ncbi:uncharacterized protein LOC110597004 isoform X16 [Ictidomys tridecemlineatus]
MSAGMARAWKKFVYLSLGTKVIGYNPIGKIHQAAKNCELKRIERYLGRGCHVDDTDQKNRTPLHYACAYGNPAVVTLLVKRKCNVDLCDSDGNTPLMKALQYEEEECAILLLEHGANPNVHNNKGETPLHCAIFYRSTSVATKLLSFNADIEARNTSGQTPLLFAIKKKRQMMVEFFINNKANIHAVDDKGRTALMFAVEHKSTQIAELLLQCGVNVSASDKCGRIALSYAIASGSTANRNLILQYMKAESRTSAIFSSVKESSEADALIRSPEKSDPGDSCIAKGEGNYEAHIKNILEEGGKLTKASRQSTKDEAKYDTGSRRSENLPDSSTPASQKKEVVETTLVQEIRIKNYSPFFPSPDSKPKQANTGCRVLNVEKFHPCLPGSVIGPFSYEEIVSQIPQNDVGHLPGDAHQTAKDDVNGHIEATSHGVDHGASEGTATHGLTPRTAPMDVVPMSSQMSESSSFQFVRAEDTVKEDTPLSCMAFQDFTHCFVKPILDRRCFLQKNIVRRTEERLCKSDKPLWFSSSEEEEEEEEGLDDTQNKQPQILSEAHPQMLISQSSGKKHYRAKEKADGHDHDMGSICSHSRGSRKSHPVTPENAGEEDAQEEPASYRASWDTSECTKHTERPVTVKEPDPCPGPGKAEAETVRSAENLVDVTSEEEQESSDDTLHNQPQILSEAHPQMRISQSSGEKHYKAKEKADGHDCVKEPIPCPGPGKAEAETVRSDVRSICSHSRGSRKSKLATPQNTGEEDAQEEPASYRASWDTTECTKHTERPITVKEPDPCPGPGKAEAETVRSAENLFDVTSEEEQESSDDTLHNQPQIISEALLQMQLSHSSGEKQHRAKEETDGHDRDMGPICSHSRGSRKSNPVTPENAGEEDAQEEPASYRASRDASACTKHTERPVTVKEPDPCPGPGKAEAETVRSAENLVDVTSEEEQESSDDTLHNQPQIFSEAHPQMQISLSSGKKHHRAKEKADGHDRDSVILLKTQKDVLRFQRKMKPKKHHCSQCSLHLKRNAQLENENFEVKKVLSEFQQENAELKQQLHDLRCALKEEAKRRNDELLREKHKDQLKEKEAEYNKEDKVRKQAEISVDTLGTKLRTARNHFDQIPTRDESDNKPLHKNHKTKDEISMRRLRTDPIKYQNQEKKCLKNTEILTEKDVDLPKTVKLNEKTLAKTFQDNEQLDIWKAERTLQNCTPESEKQRTERPETKVTSHPARPSAAPHHQGDSPTPKRNLELAFQRARDKDFSSQEEKNIDVINLEVSSEIPSQQAPKSKIQTSDLENELRKTRGTLRVMTLATQQVNRQLKQRQCQLKGMEHGHQNEQRKRNAQLRKQEASREKVSKLQSETALLQDQLHDYQNKANDKKDEIINIQSQFQDIIKRIQAQNDKHYLMLENEYMELTSETNHLKEQLDHYGKEKEVVVVRHLEKQPAGILKLPSASPEDLPHFHTNLKDKRRDLKKTLRHMTSQINDLTTKMDSASSKHLRLEANYQCFLQNLFSLKSIQDRFETIDKNQKKLEEDVVNFPRHTQGTRVEGGTEQTARCDLDEKQKQTQAAAPEVSEQLRQTGSASIKTQMELRISNLESELKTKKYN